MCPPSRLNTLTSTNPSKHTDKTPQTPLSQAALTHARDLLAPAILDHSFRVYLYASALAQHEQSIYTTNPLKHDLLFTACLFHDIGTTDTYDGPLRFEIHGADAAVTFLTQHADISATDKHSVWTAIACHTSPQIAEHIGELSRLVRLAVLTDFGRGSEAWDVLEPLRSGFEDVFERRGVEKALGDRVVEQAKRSPGKAPNVSWAGGMVKASLEEPGWEGVNRAF